MSEIQSLPGNQRVSDPFDAATVTSRTVPSPRETSPPAAPKAAPFAPSLDRLNAIVDNTPCVTTGRRSLSRFAAVMRSLSGPRLNNRIDRIVGAVAAAPSIVATNRPADPVQDPTPASPGVAPHGVVREVPLSSSSPNKIVDENSPRVNGNGEVPIQPTSGGESGVHVPPPLCLQFRFIAYCNFALISVEVGFGIVAIYIYMSIPFPFPLC